MALSQTQENSSTLAPQGDVKPLTVSQKFIKKVAAQFEASMGTSLAWTPLQMALGQNLYIKIDQTLTELEQKRSSNPNKKNDPPITWDNINFDKLAKSAERCVKNELDAGLENFIQVIPYLNARTKLYDVSIRPGYNGVDHISRMFALVPVKDIRYQLVHETDTFEIEIKDGVEKPLWKQTSPFNPGRVIGGFGYITYDDPTLNKVVIVEYREFEKARKASKGVEFWGGYQTEWVDGPNGKRVKQESDEYDERFEKEMQYKTLVYRVNKHIKLDPAKINTFELYNNIDAIDAEASDVIEANANQGEVLSMEQNAGETRQEPAGEPEPEPEQDAKDQASLMDEDQGDNPY